MLVIRPPMEIRELYSDEDGEATSQWAKPPTTIDLQLEELTTLIAEIRTGFTLAAAELSRMEKTDEALQERLVALESRKDHMDGQIVELTDVVSHMKETLDRLDHKVDEVSVTNVSLREEVQMLHAERERLIEELEKSGGSWQSRYQVRHPSSVKRDYSLRLTPNRCGSSGGDASLISCSTLPRSLGFRTSDPDSGITEGDEALPGSNEPSRRSVESGGSSDCSATVAASRSIELSRSLGERIHRLSVSSSGEEASSEQSTRSQGELQDNGPGPMAFHSDEFLRSPLLNGHHRALGGRNPPHEQTLRETQRLRVATEILETEKKYCGCLWTLLHTFSEPLKRSAIISPKELNIMFPSYLHGMYEKHCVLLRMFEQRVLNWNGLLGDIFAKLSDENNDLLDAYRTYVKDFPTALGTVAKYCKHSYKFKKFMKKCLSNPSCENLELSAYLLTPIQRIPRYVLLLKQLFKYTDVGHPDYYWIELSLQRLKDFLFNLNDSMEQSFQVVALNKDLVKPKRSQSARQPYKSRSSSPPPATTDTQQGVSRPRPQQWFRTVRASPLLQLDAESSSINIYGTHKTHQRPPCPLENARRPISTDDVREPRAARVVSLYDNAEWPRSESTDTLNGHGVRLDLFERLCNSQDGVARPRSFHELSTERQEVVLETTGPAATDRWPKEATEKAAKKPSFRDSLKKILFKKRSATQRLLKWNGRGSHQHTDQITSLHRLSPMYDENGDPCSAV